jgi:hypothetical protein
MSLDRSSFETVDAVTQICLKYSMSKPLVTSYHDRQLSITNEPARSKPRLPVFRNVEMSWVAFPGPCHRPGVHVTCQWYTIEIAPPEWLFCACREERELENKKKAFNNHLRQESRAESR